jgi:hypothetical protein
MPSMDQEGIRDFSSDAFGNQYKVEVAAAIGRLGDPVFYEAQLAREAGLLTGEVRPALVAFTKAGLLIRLGKIQGGARVYLQRVDSAFWAHATELQAELAADVWPPTREHQDGIP